MIEKNLRYQKSAKGVEVIASRSRDLNPKQRSMLILVDGKRTFLELEQISKMLGDTEALMTQLLEMGCLEAGAPVPTPATASAPARVASAVTLAEARRNASRRLTELLGPNVAEDLCLRVESARNLQEFQAAVGRADAVLRQYVNDHRADEFMQDMNAHMPPG